MTYPPTPPGEDSAPAYPAGAAPVPMTPVQPYPTAQYPAQPYPTAPYPQYQSTWPAAPPPPRRSRLWLWVTLAAVVVVGVFAAGAVGVALLVNGAQGKGTAAPATSSPAIVDPTAGPEPSEEPEDQRSITMPATVGGLERHTSPSYDNLNEMLLKQIGGQMPTSSKVGVAVYKDPESPMGSVMVMRVDLEVMRASDAAVDGAFRGMTGAGGKVSGVREIAAPAPLTGPGKCGNLKGQGQSMAVCVAADKDTISMAMFLGRKTSDVVPLFNKIRLDLVP